MITKKKGQTYPCCTAGNLTAPPEDSGGVWRYEGMLAILADDNHPEYKDILEWMGKDFDTDKFDMAAVNEWLRNLAPANV